MAIIPRFTSRVSAPGPSHSIAVAQQKGQAIAGLGNAIGNMAAQRLDALKQQQAKLDAVNDQADLAEFDSDLMQYRVTQRDAAKTDENGDDIAKRYTADFATYAKQASARFSDRPVLAARARAIIESNEAPYLESLLTVENARRTDAANIKLSESQSRQAMTVFRNPGLVDGVLGRALEDIESLGEAADLSPEDIAVARVGVRTNLYTYAVRGMIGQDPSDALSRLAAGEFDEPLQDPKVIQTLTKEAEAGVRVREAEARRVRGAARNRFKALMGDHLASLETTGQGIEGIGQTAANLLDEEELDDFLETEARAKDLWARTEEMKFATPAEMVAILGVAVPEPGTEGYADDLRAFEASRTAYARIMKAREDDPAGFAMQAPEIAEGFGVAAESEDPALMQQALRARMEFQTDMGIRQPRLLAKNEGAKIAMDIQMSEPADRPGLLAGLQAGYGELYEPLMRELEAFKVDRRTIYMADFAGDPVLSHRLAQVQEIGSAELKKGLDKGSVSDTRKAVADSMRPFRAAFETASFAGGAAERSNAISSMVEDLAFLYLRQGEDSTAAAEHAFNDVVGSKFEVIDTGAIAAYMPRAAGVSVADVEDATEFLQTREKVEAFAPALFGDTGGVPEVTYERTVTAAVNSGVWVTNEDATGLVLMLNFHGGGMLPLIDKHGKPYEMLFGDAPAIVAALPAMANPEADRARGQRQGVEIMNREFDEMRRRAQ